MNSDVWYHADKLAGALAQLLRGAVTYHPGVSDTDLIVDIADLTYARDVLAEYREGMHHRRCSQCAYVVTMADDDIAAQVMIGHVQARHRHA